MTWRLLVLALCLLWHIGGVLRGWSMVPADWCGDFATYYYATTVAGENGNPYEPIQLKSAGDADGYRQSIFPFIYPPLALPVMSWSNLGTVRGAYELWFAANYLFLFWIGYVLWRWWHPLHPGLWWFVPAALAAFYPTVNGLFQGQTNLLVMALTLTALWLAQRRPILAGALLGAAVMIKLSPAIFLLWWVVRRRWRAVASTCVALPVLAVVSLPWASLGVQADFYGRVLPALGADAFDLIRVPAGIFGNWSPSAAYAQFFPSGGDDLSAPARALWRLTGLAAVLGLGVALARLRPGGWSQAGQTGAVAVGMLLVPVYTFEHHLVWALPGLVAISAASAAQTHGTLRLGEEPAAIRQAWLWRGGLVAAWVLLAAPLFHLRRLFALVREHTLPAAALRETKLVGLVVLLVMCVYLARRARASA